MVYEGTMQYRLIYVYSILDNAHKDLLKIGQTNLDSTHSAKELSPNCEELNHAAHNRIKQQTSTALVEYELLYTELALRPVRLNDGSEEFSAFKDDDVHNVLYQSGYTARKLSGSKMDSEWFKVTLPVVKNAIAAVKQGRNSLTATEKADTQIGQLSLFDDTTVPVPQRKITLRDEQAECVNRTVKIFRTQNRMLWDCKMRFGKTVTAYALIKEENFQRVIVVTHRPVVVDGWRKDFDLMFGADSNRAFLSKDCFETDTAFDAAMDARNDSNLHNFAQSGRAFVYFASMQDLRGSQLAGGKYNKNNAVFAMPWNLIIYDEAHEGTQTDLGQSVQELLENPKNDVAPKILELSGTPYNIQSKYENNVYSWDYVMEQKRKEEWGEIHPGDPNPYADLPKMHILTFDLGTALPTSYRYETVDMAFNFAEFFRTWTGDPQKDFRPLPPNTKVGEFVHEDDVNSFLNLITNDSEDSNYPFSTPERRANFQHTFWMVPGVKEARALSALLQRHCVFGHYQIANVAGDGDAEMPYDNALKLVQDTIRKNEYTITISCGRLTTGVTVPEWTAVMMLAGSSSTSAAGYMQTIFRVQSAGQIDGKQKEHCYVFDFAPDRALSVLSEVHQLNHKGSKNDEADRALLSEFLNFCPVIAVNGTQMVHYDVEHMMREIKHITVENAIKSGFDDESIYNRDTGIVMDEEDAKLFHELSDKLSEQKAAPKQTKVKINGQGLTNEEYQKAEKLKSKPKRERTPLEEELLKKLAEQKKEREKAINLLRNISIRLPLLIYGAKVDLTDTIRMQDFVTLVDDESWQEFMPKQVSKALFRKLLKYYDEDVVIGAGLRIRRMAKAADELPPTKRVQRIAEIFSHFRNPDKETVLTPWRVVNRHLSDMLGGYCFFNEQFDEQGLLENPRLVEQGNVTSDLFLNPDARILEMNSKSGLYPLYIAYTLYALQLPNEEDKLPLEQTQRLWQQVVQNNIFVLCRTKMAASITQRTLAGYQPWRVNTTCPTKLLERMETDSQRLAHKLTNPATWGKEGERMKFDAIVGNPPYQVDNAGAKASSTAIYPLFVDSAKAIKPRYLSMIIPARWFAAGRGVDEFRTSMLSDDSISCLHDFYNANECFPSVDIKGGLTYFLRQKGYHGTCHIVSHKSNDEVTLSDRPLLEPQMDVFIRDSEVVSILKKIMAHNEDSFADIVSPRDPFGYDIRVPGSYKTVAHQYRMEKSEEDSIAFYYFGWRKNGEGYVNAQSVGKNTDWVSRPKVLIPNAWGTGETSSDKLTPFIPLCDSVCTETYLVIGPFDTYEQCHNVISYMQTKFFHILVSILKVSQHATQSVYKFVPMQDFSKPWTDAELYAKYALTPEEIAFIESTIKPME